ncbi:MAG: Fe-S protein assembly co-chaperone HscB [Ktedonobacterales bacterium]
MATGNKPESALQLIDQGKITQACWSCGDMRAAHFCNSCGKLQPALPTDYFTFFGLPRKLSLDTSLLEREFYVLSRKLHPDIYARATGQEQHWSLEKSSQLNDAYRTLRDPIARTEYLLKLEGVQLEEQSKAATDKARQTGEEKKQVIPPELLEEVFELNMQLEEARMNKKMGERDADLLREVESTRNDLQAKHDALMDELRGYWNEWDALPGDASEAQRKPVRDKMIGLLNRRSYIKNLVRDVSEVLEQ